MRSKMKSIIHRDPESPVSASCQRQMRIGACLGTVTEN